MKKRRPSRISTTVSFSISTVRLTRSHLVKVAIGRDRRADQVAQLRARHLDLRNRVVDAVDLDVGNWCPFLSGSALVSVISDSFLAYYHDTAVDRWLHSAPSRRAQWSHEAGEVHDHPLVVRPSRGVGDGRRCDQLPVSEVIRRRSPSTYKHEGPTSSSDAISENVSIELNDFLRSRSGHEETGSDRPHDLHAVVGLVVGVTIGTKAGLPGFIAGVLIGAWAHAVFDASVAKVVAELR